MLYVREIAVIYGGGTVAKKDWREDPEAAAILGTAVQIGKTRGVTTLPVFANATNAAGLIVDMAATLGVDYLMLGATQPPHHGQAAEGQRGDRGGRQPAG